MAKKTKQSKVKLPTFKLSQLAYSIRVITSDYETWCNKPLPSDDTE